MDKTVMVLRGKGGVEEGKGGRIHSHERRLDFGWRSHNAISR